MEKNVPLCWPTDTVYARMAELMFYKPHNAVTLYNTKYAWLDDEELVGLWPKHARRRLIDADHAKELNRVVEDFRAGLKRVHDDYFDRAGKPSRWPLDQHPLLKFPRLLAHEDATPEERARVEREECFGAGIQY